MACSDFGRSIEAAPRAAPANSFGKRLRVGMAADVPQAGAEGRDEGIMHDTGGSLTSIQDSRGRPCPFSFLLGRFLIWASRHNAR